jgi:hypothetical protein
MLPVLAVLREICKVSQQYGNRLGWGRGEGEEGGGGGGRGRRRISRRSLFLFLCCPYWPFWILIILARLTDVRASL